jgi:hypothetical protein
MQCSSRARLLACAALVALGAASAACGKPALHRTGAATFPPRERGCTFQVIGTAPGPDHVEVAQVVIEGDFIAGTGVYRDPQEFAAAARDQICAAGGDLLVTEVNGQGVIARGIVFHRVATHGVAADRAPTAPPPAGACEPICSPGFRCQAGTCIPQCNPTCDEGETCGKDRTCHRNANP